LLPISNWLIDQYILLEENKLVNWSIHSTWRKHS